MGDIFGIIPDAKPPKGKEGHVQDIFGTWHDPRVPKQQPQQHNQPRPPPKQRPQTNQPIKRGYVTESYIQTGKDIVKGVRYGIKGAKYLNKLRKEHQAKKHQDVQTTVKEFKIEQDYPKTAKDKEFKIKQDY